MSSRYETLIDGTDYRTIESYLNNRESPVEYILHVRERAMLPDLAQHLDKALERKRAAPEHIRDLVVPMMEQGNLLLTSRRPLLLPFESLVPSSEIAKDSFCSVIYLPPFYLSHTSGLFESIKAKQQVDVEPPTPAQRIKI